MTLERLAPVGEPTDWRCRDCAAEGSIEELDAIDCPNGMAPYYGPDAPIQVVLAERDANTHVERFIVSRTELYNVDERFERALQLSKLQQKDVLRRLGAIDGQWVAFSNIDDGYIGTPSDARDLVERGIAPQKRQPDHTGCSIGFCEHKQKWYGWSHRAGYGFGIGYIVKDGAAVTESLPVGFEAKTLDDCRRCAVAFAASVS